MSHFVLADCNNFYASCERLFNPKLEKKPIVVLSNNDGCVVARSQEAKKIGIKMGQPYFEIKDLCLRQNVIIFSSNYRLYGDLSERVMNILSDSSPNTEIYSIDEAFLKFPNSLSSADLFSKCAALRRKIKKWVGLPISLGFGPTKTLAKIANDLAKKCDEGVFDITSPEVQQTILQDYPIGEIWGVGSRLKARLNAIGIQTAWEFREADPLIIRKKFGVVGERMVWELRGFSCLDLKETEPKKSITSSRSFGKTVTHKQELGEALAAFVSKACVKLRAQKSCASAVCVCLEAAASLSGGHFSRRHYNSIFHFPIPTNDTAQIISAAKMVLSQIFIDKERYKKCGIILLDLIPENQLIPDLIYGGLDPKRQLLMKTIDELNGYFGKNTLFFAAEGIDPQWKSRALHRSAHNTTEWDRLGIVFAC